MFLMSFHRNKRWFIFNALNNVFATKGRMPLPNNKPVIAQSTGAYIFYEALHMHEVYIKLSIVKKN